MLGFTTGPKPTHFNDFIGLLVLGTCAFPVLLLAVYRTFLYIIYGSKVAYKFKSHWQAAFVPTLLLSVLLIIGYLVTIFRDSEESRTSNNSSAISKPSITIRDAISQGDITVVQQHLTNGANVNAMVMGSSLLDIARHSGKFGIAKILREHGGKTGAELSIYVAIDSENILSIKEHLINGLPINMDNEFESSLLFYAASGGRMKSAELLITEGADVNYKTDRGETALHGAAKSSYDDIVELLITKGADVNAKDDGGETPLDFAYDETADLLRKHGGKTGEELKAEGK